MNTDQDKYDSATTNDRLQPLSADLTASQNTYNFFINISIFIRGKAKEKMTGYVAIRISKSYLQVKSFVGQ